MGRKKDQSTPGMSFMEKEVWVVEDKWLSRSLHSVSLSYYEAVTQHDKKNEMYAGDIFFMLFSWLLNCDCGTIGYNLHSSVNFSKYLLLSLSPCPKLR